MPIEYTNKVEIFKAICKIVEQNEKIVALLKEQNKLFEEQSKLFKQQGELLTYLKRK